MLNSPLPLLSGTVEQDLLQVFKLLSDETRFRILVYLAHDGELNVTSLCEYLGHSQPAVSHHLALLRIGGLIKMRRDGKNNFYSVFTAKFNRLLDNVFHSLGPPGGEIRLGKFALIAPR